MNTRTLIVAAAALAVGVGIGWVVKPAPEATHPAENREIQGRKARIAESRSRVKMVTTIVTNTVHDTVTNTVEVVREQRRGPEAWQEEMERLKEENPTEYAARTNRMAVFRKQMLQRAENRLETLASIDTTGWSKRQIATHERYQDLIAKREELMDILRPDSGATEEQRRDAAMQMRELWRELHKTGAAERETLMSQTIRALGYRGTEAKEIQETIKTIYSTTQDWGGHHGGGQRGGEPLPRHR